MGDFVKMSWVYPANPRPKPTNLKEVYIYKRECNEEGLLAPSNLIDANSGYITYYYNFEEEKWIGMSWPKELHGPFTLIRQWEKENGFDT